MDEDEEPRVYKTRLGGKIRKARMHTSEESTQE